MTALGTGKIPDRVHVLVLDEGFGEVVAFAGDDDDHSGGHIGGFKCLVEIRSAERCFWLGIRTTGLPWAMAGAINETKACRGYSSGQATPITPMGSLTPKVTSRRVVSCTMLTYLSAQAV